MAKQTDPNGGIAYKIGSILKKKKKSISWEIKSAGWNGRTILPY